MTTNATPGVDAPSPAAERTIEQRRALIWNGWTRSAGRKGWEGCITHAWDEEGPAERRGKSLCGVRLSDGGGLNLQDDWSPGCIRCKKILRERGLIPPKAAPGNETP